MTRYIAVGRGALVQTTSSLRNESGSLTVSRQPSTEIVEGYKRSIRVFSAFARLPRLGLGLGLRLGFG